MGTRLRGWCIGRREPPSTIFEVPLAKKIIIFAAHLVTEISFLVSPMHIGHLRACSLVGGSLPLRFLRWRSRKDYYLRRPSDHRNQFLGLSDAYWTSTCVLIGRREPPSTIFEVALAKRLLSSPPIWTPKSVSWSLRCVLDINVLDHTFWVGDGRLYFYYSESPNQN